MPEQLFNTEILKHAIHDLIHDYPGMFDLLSVTEFESTDAIDAITYNYVDQIVMYNEQICNDISVLRGCLAFTGLLVTHSDLYCNVPENNNQHKWNLAVHTHIVNQLNALGEFTFPDNVVLDSLGTDRSKLSLTELYDAFVTLDSDDA